MTYEKDFEKFLQHTDEKKVLLEEILKEIEKHKVSSLLDIGAGEGLLSVPLSRKMDRYVAVEESPLFAKKLRDAGVVVKEEKFPFKADELFDMVLISHALPDKNYEDFLKSAWERVKRGGRLLVITYKDKESEWVDLLKKIKEEKVELDRVDYRKISSFLNKLGEVEIRKVFSHICGSEEDVIAALSFVFHDGDEEKKKRFAFYKEDICAILQSKYKDRGGVSFPIPHFFISVKKEHE